MFDRYYASWYNWGTDPVSPYNGTISVGIGHHVTLKVNIIALLHQGEVQVTPRGEGDDGGICGGNELGVRVTV